MKFTLEINLGNDAMNSSADLALALKRVSERIVQNEYVEILRTDESSEITRGVLDVNGATVGSFSLKKED